MRKNSGWKASCLAPFWVETGCASTGLTHKRGGSVAAHVGKGEPWKAILVPKDLGI